MSAHKAPSKARQTYKFIAAHRNKLSIQVMWRGLGIADVGYVSINASMLAE